MTLLKIVTTVCGKPPKGMGRWSTQGLAKKLKLSKSNVHGVLKEHDLHPHRLRTFNFSPDHQFEENLCIVTEIAFRCGFQSSQYFAKAFRERHGLTPSEHRKSKGGDV